MINPAGMIGLQNDPAMQAIRGMQKSIGQLIALKTTDTKDEIKFRKREQEENRREAQDLKRLQQLEAQDYEKAKQIVKNTEAGKTAALLGGAALLGAISVISGLDLGKLAKDTVKGAGRLLNANAEEKVDDFTGPSSEMTETAADQETPKAAANESGDLDPASKGGIEQIESSDDKNFKPLPKPAYLEVTSRVGPRWGKLHRGVDIAAPEGTPMTVWTSAKVTSKGYEASGYGHYVSFKTKKGEHFYAHMKSPSKMSVGQNVRRGEIIGLCGNSGGSKGPHLHWEFSPRMGEVGYVRKNPIDVLNAGYKATQPFLGKQDGGVVGQVVPMIQKQRPLSSLTAGKNDMVYPGGVSSFSGIPFSELNDNTIIHAYIGSNNRPMIGYGSTTIKGGNEPVKMGQRITKREADKRLRLDITGISNDLSKTLRSWPRMSKNQRAGVVSMQQSIGRDAHKSSDPQFRKYSEAIQRGDMQRATSPGVLPNIGRSRSKEISMMRSPTGYQSGGVVGYQSGGMTPKTTLVNMMRPVMNQIDTLVQNYTPEFYERQARKATQSPVIIVNNSSGSPSAPIPTAPIPSHPSSSQGINYTDIAHVYSSMCRGLKI
jgi:murein DD-endopeptidase MepM/ murein hydrolase activator NlpD